MVSGDAWAAASAADDASDAVYGDGWATGDNGGSGFGAWTLTAVNPPASSGHFIGTSVQNGDGADDGFSFPSDSGQDGLIGDGDINTGNNAAWGMYANSISGPVGLSEAERGFTGALIVGDLFSIDMDHGYTESGSTAGFALENDNGETLWEFFYTGFGNYTVQDAGGFTAVPNLIGDFTTEGLTIEFSLTSATTYSATMTFLGGFQSDTVTGTLLNPAGGQDVEQVRLYNNNSRQSADSSGPGAPWDLFFNNLSIQAIPEPGTFSLTAIGLITFLALRRRRRG